MGPNMRTLVAGGIYGVQNAIMEYEFGQRFSPIVILTIAWAIMLAMNLARIGASNYTGEELSWPTGGIIWFFIINGVLWYFADMFYVSAYSAGGKVETVTMIMMAFPAMAILAKFIYSHGAKIVEQSAFGHFRDLPKPVIDAPMVVGYILICLGLYFIVIYKR